MLQTQPFHCSIAGFIYLLILLYFWQWRKKWLLAKFHLIFFFNETTKPGRLGPAEPSWSSWFWSIAAVVCKSTIYSPRSEFVTLLVIFTQIRIYRVDIEDMGSFIKRLYCLTFDPGGAAGTWEMKLDRCSSSWNCGASSQSSRANQRKATFKFCVGGQKMSGTLF